MTELYNEVKGREAREGGKSHIYRVTFNKRNNVKQTTSTDEFVGKQCKGNILPAGIGNGTVHQREKPTEASALSDITLRLSAPGKKREDRSRSV